MANDKKETIAEIVAEMRHGLDKSWHDIDREWVHGLADRIEAAAKRESDRQGSIVSSALNAALGEGKITIHRGGNAAGMREALDAVVSVGYPHNFQREAPHIRGYCYDITKAIKKCFAALSAPPRNCDRYSHNEALEIWAAEKENGENGCFDEWLYATAKKEGGEE